MEKSADNFYRSQIKEGLARLTEKHYTLFKRMYSPKNYGKPINKIVDDMPEEDLDHALDQVNRTLAKMKGTHGAKI